MPTTVGSNTLRGGVHSFGASTLVGNWAEDRLAQVYDRARPRIETERQARDLEATGRILPPFAPHLTSTPVTLPTPPVWLSTPYPTHGMPPRPQPEPVMTPPTPVTLQVSPSVIPPPSPARFTRFTPESTHAFNASVAPHHVVTTLRALPGVTRSVEVVRSRALERHGVHGVARIVMALRDADLSREGLTQALREAGVKLSVDETADVWRQLQPDETVAPLRSTLIEALCPVSLTGVRETAVACGWRVASGGSDSIPLRTLFKFMTGELEPYLTLLTWCVTGESVPPLSEGDVITYPTLVRAFQLISSSVDSDAAFAAHCVALWRLEQALYALPQDMSEDLAAVLDAARVQRPPARSLTVSVTYSDGRKALKRVALDVFLDVDSDAAVVARLERQGEAGVVALSRDF